MRRRLRRGAALGAVLLAGLAALALLLTRPRTAPADALAGIEGDATRGARIFDAAGCAGCHMAPDAPDGDPEARLRLSGGQAFPSPFGTFRAPNISPDPEAGIGRWSALDLYNALHFGTSPEGRHYYPAFPYTSYVNASRQDVADLYAYLMTLPPDATPSRPHEVAFPFNIRAGLGLWKALFLRPGWVVKGPLSAEQARGRYLAEALGHCGECHTPRNALGGLRRDSWLAGAPIPGGRGRFPNITPARLDWSQADLIEYFTSGFTPEYDSAGGHMAVVVQNLALLPREDRAALAAYLQAVAPVPEAPS